MNVKILQTSMEKPIRILRHSVCWPHFQCLKIRPFLEYNWTLCGIINIFYCWWRKESCDIFWIKSLLHEWKTSVDVNACALNENVRNFRMEVLIEFAQCRNSLPFAYTKHKKNGSPTFICVFARSVASILFFSDLMRKNIFLSSVYRDRGQSSFILLKNFCKRCSRIIAFFCVYFCTLFSRKMWSNHLRKNHCIKGQYFMAKLRKMASIHSFFTLEWENYRPCSCFE